MNKKFYLIFAIGFFIATQSFAMKSFSDFGISYHLLSETGLINTDDGVRVRGVGSTQASAAAAAIATPLAAHPKNL